MSKSKKKVFNDFSGIMYSTDSSFEFEGHTELEEQTLAPNQQDLRVMLDKKK